MIADYGFYRDRYFGEMLTEENFPKYASRADVWLDELTLGRYERDDLPEKAVLAVKTAECAIAELCVTLEQAELRSDAAWAVALVQNRLSQLGYLPEDSADGVFGEGTATGVRLFQAQIGRAASGVADVKTQEALFAIDAPRNPRPLDIPIEEKSDGKSSGKASTDDASQDGDIYDDFKFSSLMNDSDEDVDFSDVQPETSEPEPDEDEDQGNPFQDNGVEEE